MTLNLHFLFFLLYPDLTLFYAEMRDLGKFDTMPFFSGCCEKGCRDNTLTVISFFKDLGFRGKVWEYSWHAMKVN